MSPRARRGARVAVVALVGLLAAACETTRRPRPGAAIAPQAFFWEATAPDGGKLFLFGSVHIGDGRELALDPRIESDWQAAQELVVELDITSLSPIDAVEAMNRHGLLPEPQTLQQVVRADTYKQVVAYMKQRDSSMDRIDQMRPWMVALQVQDLEYNAVGLEPENGVDAVLLRRAKGKKPIRALETLDEQMGAFASLPDAVQETWLLGTIRESQALLDVTRDLLRAWEAGDEAKLMAVLFSTPDSGVDQAEFYERIYWSRNQVMTDRLVGLAADGKPRFVVIGTGHLLGARGIPELLAQRGFRVSRMGTARVVGGTMTAPATAAAAAPPSPRTAEPSAPVAMPTPAAPSPTPSSVATTAPSSAPAPSPTPALQAAPATPTPAESPRVEPTPAPAPSRDIHDQWLGEDVESAATPPAPAQQPAATQTKPAPSKATAKPSKTKSSTAAKKSTTSKATTTKAKTATSTKPKR